MIVWIPMRPEDSAATAHVSARRYGDHRVDHFYDADRSAGRAIARGLGGEGDVAWDIYLKSSLPQSCARHRDLERGAF
jgi:hypothetical protein